MEHANFTSDEEEMGISPSNFDIQNQRYADVDSHHMHKRSDIPTITPFIDKFGNVVSEQQLQGQRT